MRVFLISLSVLLLLVGFCLAHYASSLPVYYGNFSPGDLSYQLSQLPEDQQDAQWLTEMAAHETPSKMEFDLGAGLLALGVSGLLAVGVISLYYSLPKIRCSTEILKLWIFAWMLEIPGSIWLLKTRQARFDFPPWSDSMGIPIFTEFILTVFGGLLTGLILWLLLRNRSMTSPLHFATPRSTGEWFRSGFLCLWFISLLWLRTGIVPDGEVGTIMSSIVGSALVLIVLAAKPLTQGS